MPYSSSQTLVRILSQINPIHNFKPYLLKTYKGGRDSSVGIATRYGLDGPGIESAPVQIDPWTHSASCTMGTRSLSRV